MREEGVNILRKRGSMRLNNAWPRRMKAGHTSTHCSKDRMQSNVMISLNVLTEGAQNEVD